ncbi:MAG: PorT family protein [Bacteroidetes bacterium]|nr:PorT family protein [Bacteroidota bacterium]
MKKFIFSAVLLVAFTTNSLAQNTTDNREKFQIGLKAGANYSNVYDGQGEEFKADAKVGFAGGFFMELPFGKYFGIQPECLYSQKGFKAEGKFLNNKYQFTRTTTYLDIPIQLAFKPSEFITLLAGPQISYLISQKDVFTSTPNSYEQEQGFKNDNLRKNVFGVVGGIDVNIKHITIGARAAWDLQTNRGDGTSFTPRYKNAWFQGTIAYKFHRS